METTGIVGSCQSRAHPPVKFLTARDDGQCKAVATQEVNDVKFDPFEVLGIKRNATEREIMSAHRRLSDVFCPDRWRDAESEVQVEALRWSEAVDQAVQNALQISGATQELVPLVA